MNWTIVALVGAGGALGALARFAITRALVGISTRQKFPINTLLINLSGSALLGAIMAFAQSAEVPLHQNPLLMFAGPGFCGAFTTFSTFAVETTQLVEASRVRAGIYALLTLGGAILSFGGAMALTSALL